MESLHGTTVSRSSSDTAGSSGPWDRLVAEVAACAVCGTRPNWSRHQCGVSWQIKVVRKKKWTPYVSARGRRIFRPYEEFIDILWDSSGRYRVCTRKHRRRKDAERHAKQAHPVAPERQRHRGADRRSAAYAPTRSNAREPGARAGLSDAVWRLIREMYDGRCYYCGKAGKKLHKEHRVPLARGGSNDISNIVPSCEPCNRRKGILTDDEFFKLLEDEFAYRPTADDDSNAAPPRRPFPVKSPLTATQSESQSTEGDDPRSSATEHEAVPSMHSGALARRLREAQGQVRWADVPLSRVQRRGHQAVEGFSLGTNRARHWRVALSERTPTITPRSYRPTGMGDSPTRPRWSRCT